MKRILVGLDASARARPVLKAAVELAESTGAKLVLLRAVGVPVELPIEAYRLSPASLAEVLQQEAERGLLDLSKEVPPTRLESCRVGVGAPWQVVCDAAKELDVDLIVIGSHGRSGVQKLVLGSVAGKVVTLSARPVLVVR